MVEGRDVYADPSVLGRLYFQHANSREVVLWRRQIRGPLPVTHHGKTEIINAIALAVFRRAITNQEAEKAWDWLEEDFRTGQLVKVDLLWRSALNRSAELSREHSPTIGCRSADVLHVSCALELGVKRFASFDVRQNALASAVGLKLVTI